MKCVFFLEIQNCKFIQVDTTAHLLVHMHSIADGTRFQTRIEFICLRYTESPADKKPPPMHLHFWVGLTKKILHTVAVSALLWFFLSSALQVMATKYSLESYAWKMKPKISAKECALHLH